ncbi:translation initiation factor eIF 4e-like domain-containing protein [Dioszegia hungarica]|uniref:Translation initiation factor eIF 4e-like domain-containing protein n=1 Tax=Dioszegia hungarica TaxID=4972 RepID=A0AA38H7R9_9TREE|nr:translation initiation factor eIF 4e-like domain-containing protein [Dioszegia hungarica]KAI9636010.1 translation initiation factor eIF 4e-like domain-containing protein [Dioszegia hungarica]
MSQPPSSRRTTSTQGSSRLALSVGKTANGTGAPVSAPERHPLKHDWSVSYVHRPPGTKVDYEKEIKRVATFGSIESFLHIYSHLIPPNELQPVTDVLVFLARIPTPGTWECMPDGGKFTIRLVHPITPLLFESLLFALIGDQFDEEDRVVGCVLSARQPEDLISVWVEDEGEALRSGALREKILALLNLPPSAICEYRSNRALLDAVGTGNNTGPIGNPQSNGPTSTMATPMSNSTSNPSGADRSQPSNRSYNSHAAEEGGGGGYGQRYGREGDGGGVQGQGPRTGMGGFGGRDGQRNGWGGAVGARRE